MSMERQDITAQADAIAATLLGAISTTASGSEVSVPTGVAKSGVSSHSPAQVAVSAQANPVVRNSTERKAITLLGQGIQAEVVAAACGVTPSYISQLMSDESIVGEVAELRFHNLQKHNDRDDKYDTLEDKLIKQFDNMSSTLFDPMKLLRAIQVINAAKRRGSSAPEQITQQNTVVQLNMPVSIVQKFTTNIHNQVIHAGEQTLQTIQSHTLFDAAKKKFDAATRGLPDGTLAPEYGVLENSSTNSGG